jgi:TolA-binding protein
LADKISKKDLREPDDFISFTSKAAIWIYDHRGLLISTGLVIVVIILGLFAWRWHLEDATQKASAAFVDAQQIMEARVVARDDADGTSQVDGTYSSEQDKLHAALVGLKAVKENHASSATAVLATYFIGECYWQLGESDKAVAAFEEYLRSVGPTGELAPFAIEGIAATHEDKGELDQAKQQYRRLTEEPFASQRARGLYHLARLEQKEGRGEQAAILFKALMKEFPTTPYAREIQERLSSLPNVPDPVDEPAEGDPAAPAPADDQAGKDG